MWILLWMFRYISSLSNIFFAFWFIIGHFNSYYLKSKKFKSHKNHNCVLIQYHQITHAIGNWPAKVKVSENIIIKTQLSAPIIPVLSLSKTFSSDFMVQCKSQLFKSLVEPRLKIDSYFWWKLWCDNGRSKRLHFSNPNTAIRSAFWLPVNYDH